ncbi:LytR/AlgR family response regulator transcription factor [Spirosoma radiotolerans]|uniref:LytTR family two component transcriptional regulator n=1 Tax=Spirosoma radiotolerans TaxID=1379870 RepID=A0A0E3ZZ12_9BACT|nr:LytTR family DNA-binding domain-containing protein [Spirosoma radiotolerans]AKD57350.1 LytTR family two component transcriptional regulator [Spirosoma radiotolerans]
MTTYNCLIVDDEPIAREIVKTYCGHLPNLHVAAMCGNSLEAKAVMQTKAIDILFLDINMPVLDGIAFLKTLKSKPQVIFTTAYKEFAVNAFDLSACDYLLKPFSLDRFIVAVDKAVEKLAPEGMPTTDSTKRDAYLFIKFDGKICKILHDDLLYAEANGNYTKIVTMQNLITPSMAFSTFTELLPQKVFIRIHRSFIVNKSRITHIEGNRVFIDTIELPIGSNYKDDFMREIGIRSQN